jgi:hypothetical protein
MLADEDTTWSKLTVERWYGDAPREVEVVTDSAVWYHSGKPPMLLRWVLIRDPHKCFEPQALLSTDLDRTPEQILTWFIRRWTMEVTRELTFRTLFRGTNPFLKPARARRRQGS